MREEKFALDKVNQLNQMHDEVMSGLFIEKDALILAFEELLRPGKAVTSCEMIFRGFEDMDADIRALVYDMDTDLNMRGEKLYLREFVDKFVVSSKPIMEIIELYCGSSCVLLRGELKPSRRRVLLQIGAQELVYRWR